MLIMATTSELTAGIIGGFLGGALGVVSTLVGSYYGPRKFEDVAVRARRCTEEEVAQGAS